VATQPYVQVYSSLSRLLEQDPEIPMCRFLTSTQMRMSHPFYHDGNSFIKDDIAPAWLRCSRP